MRDPRYVAMQLEKVEGVQQYLSRTVTLALNDKYGEEISFLSQLEKKE